MNPIRLFYCSILSLVSMSGACDDARAADAGRSGALVPRIVVEGIEKYQFSGATAAVKYWLNYSDDKVSPDAGGYANSLVQAEANYGKFVGYHVVQVVQISPATSVSYLVFNYERGLLFARFTTYQYKSFRTVTEMDFSPKIDAVFPEQLRQ